MERKIRLTIVFAVAISVFGIGDDMKGMKGHYLPNQDQSSSSFMAHADEGKDAPDALQEQEGSAVFASKCERCHLFDSRIVGPPLNEVLPKYRNDVGKLREYIMNPYKVDPGYPSMPKLGLKEKEVEAVARYLFEKVKVISLSAGRVSSFQETIPGNVLRKSAGKLVFSLGRFEIGEKEAVTIRNKITGEEMDVELSSVYDDSSYSVVFDEDIYNRIDPLDYECYTVWNIPEDVEKMGEILAKIHEYQNWLRKNLGGEMISGGQFVSSRFVIAKIQKFHKIGADIVRRFFKTARKKDQYDLFTFSISFEIEFSPDLARAFGGNVRLYERALKELLYEEFSRTFWFMYGFNEDLIDLIFNLPLTLKNFTLKSDAQNHRFFIPSPYIEVPKEVLNAAWYIYRQGLEEEIGRKVKHRLFRDSLISDRKLLRRVIVNGWTIGTVDEALILSFSSPYVRPGDTVYLELDDGDDIQVKIRLADGVRSFSVTEKVEPEVRSRVTSKTPVSLFSE